MGEANSRDDQQDDQRTANEAHENETGQIEERNHFMSVYTTSERGQVGGNPGE